MFPEYYPPSCPPADAKKPDGTTVYYRLVRKPMTLDDVKSPYELKRPHSTTCDDCALSLYKGPGGVQRLINGYSWASGGWIASLCPSPDWGLIRTGSPKGSGTHTNFWLCVDARRDDILKAMQFHEEDGK